MSKIRILSVINGLYFGGDENRLLAFAKTIDCNRFDHVVVCLKKIEPILEKRYGTLRNEFANAKISVRYLEESGSAGADGGAPVVGRRRVVNAVASGFRSIRKLCHLIREQGTDLIDAHLDPGGTAGVLAAVAMQRRRVFTTYNAEPLVAPWEPLLLWRMRHQIALCMTNAIVTDSEARKKDLQRWIFRKNVPVYVIPNGVFPPMPKRSRAEVCAILDLPVTKSTKIVGQISSIHRYKGHMNLLEAAHDVLKHEDVYFLIVGYSRGDDSYLIELQERARALGIANRVRIGGYADSIGDIWQLIDVHAHAATIDSLPNAIIEGMSLAKPAVVTSVGGIPTMVEDHRTGLVVAPNDSGALGDAILTLLRNPVLAKRLGKAALDRYQKRYTPVIMTRSLEDLFVSICKQN